MNTAVHERAFHELAASALAGRRPAFDFPVDLPIDLVARKALPAVDTQPLPDDRGDLRAAFVRWAAVEGLAGLLLRATSDDPGWSSVRDALREATLRQAAVAILQEQELRRVLEALAQDGIRPLVFKGAALAYTSYPDPALRPRMDTDLLIRDDDVPSVRVALARLGYTQDIETSGRLVTSQFHYTRSDAHGVRHALDVHVRLANVRKYADRLTYDDLRREAVPLSRLGPGAIGPSAVYALLIACLHRIAHHWDEPTLLWLYDIRLLAGALSDTEWERMLKHAEARQLSSVVLRGLARTGEAFGPCAPGEVLERLERAAVHETSEPLFDPETRTVDVLISDLGSLSGAREKLQLLREHLFPPLVYMQQRYAGCPLVCLPLMYAYRIACGAPKWFRRKTSTARGG